MVCSVACRERNSTFDKDRRCPQQSPREGGGYGISPTVLVSVGVVLGLIVILTGCASPTRGQPLSPAEQAEFAIYRKVMTPAQTRTYLAKATPAERTAYLQESGLAQRFQALDPHDREAVQHGFLRKGMSAEALQFV
jgi:hypothetical protein